MRCPVKALERRAVSAETRAMVATPLWCLAYRHELSEGSAALNLCSFGPARQIVDQKSQVARDRDKGNCDAKYPQPNARARFPLLLAAIFRRVLSEGTELQ